ncbi:hypothetical protein K503DRAFT_801659 [Rhizopogon vinicolor AM-OR11-026]|uniref:Uncharacterized protein n=1 Tax=Rhizopogon vinicolor AM-OR11-026 TaxID=1314800 RepID=A0A1B7MWA1_9AGAM|nr:hypothetical protein K503DRAFT_801659 [Rhizopogon vinicolor AM-OR11-026]
MRGHYTGSKAHRTPALECSAQVDEDGRNEGNEVNSYGGLVLGIAALDGLLIGSKYIVMDTPAMRWATHRSDMSFSRVLGQERNWFDRSENGERQDGRAFGDNSDATF